MLVGYREDRLTSLCVSSAILAAGYFLLLAQKKVTKEKGTLGTAPLAERAVREGRTGLAKRPSMASRPNRRDPSRRPRAGHAAGPSTLRRGFRADPKSKSWIPAFAGMTAPGVLSISDTCCFCGRDRCALRSSRASLGRGEQVEEKPRVARARARMHARLRRAQDVP